MNSSLRSFLLTFLTLLSLALPPVESLTAVFTETKLPASLYDAAAFYDGQDLIYLLGGFKSNTASSEILRFNVTSSTIERAGRLPHPGDGSVEFDSEGNLFFFGGINQPFYKTIFKIDLASNISSEIEEVLSGDIVLNTAKFNSSSDQVYFFGGAQVGNPFAISEFDMKTHAQRLVGNLPLGLHTYSNVVIDGKGYLFGDSFIGPDCVFVIDLETFQSEAGPRDLPDYQGIPSTVYDGKDIYIYGGYKGLLGAPLQAIIQFNPITFNHTFVPIEGTLLQEGEYVSKAPTTLYVDKLNRIYFFGGLTHLGEDIIFHDEIWYLDLNSLE